MGRPIIVLCVALVPILRVITTTQNDMAALFVTLYLHFGQIVRTLCGISVFFYHQTVKRPRKVPVNLLNLPPSPDDRVFNNDYNDDYNYDPDRRSVYSGAQDHSTEREHGRGEYMDSGYQTRERDYDRDYDRRERGRSTERDLSPGRNYRRDGSRGRILNRDYSPDHPREYSPDRRYRSERALDRGDYSPDRRYRSERAIDREYSPDRRYRSERALDRDHSPDRRYRSERTLDRTNSPDLRHRGGTNSPPRGRERDHSLERGRDHVPPEPRRYDEHPKRSGSRDRLDHSPSPTAMPIPLPRPVRDIEPLEKPLNVLLVKNRPNEGEMLIILCCCITVTLIGHCVWLDENMSSGFLTFFF